MARCEHQSAAVTRACVHALTGEDDYLLRFTGRGAEHAYVCPACRDVADAALIDACATCEARARVGSWSGVIGAPSIVDVASAVHFTTTSVVGPGAPVLALAALPTRGDRARALVALADGALVRWDLDAGTATPIGRLPTDAGLALDEPLALIVSATGRFAAVANARGQRGAVIELASGRTTLALARGTYQTRISEFPLAFAHRGGRDLVVHATAWNRLEVSDAETGALLTARAPLVYERDGERPPHYLDYFHCGLAVSPDQRSIVDNGWVWSPVGEVVAWSLERWLAHDPFESEDGASRKTLTWRGYFWDGPLCWLDDRRVALYGFGHEDDWLVRAACIHDATTGALLAWFPGPTGPFVAEPGGGVLFDLDTARGVTAWDVARGARLATGPVVSHYLPDARVFVAIEPDGSRATLAAACGRAADAPWVTAQVRDLAHAIARDRAYADLPILGDALEQAGCDDAALLAHCRAPGEHAARCWAIERLAI